MYISKLTIKNYRGISNQTLSFSNFNTLIGKNDCGKSTIINCIKLFFNDEKVNQRDFNYYVTEHLPIEIEAEISDFDINSMRSFLIEGEKTDGFDEVVQDYVHNGAIALRKDFVFKEQGEIQAKTFIKVTDFKDINLHDLKKAELSKLIKELNVSVLVNGSGNNSDIEKKSFIREKLIQDKVERVYRWLEIKYSDLKNSLPFVETFRADQSIETTTSEFKGTFSLEVRTIINQEREDKTNVTLSGIERKIALKIEEESKAIQKCMSEHISDLSKLIITPSFSWEKGVEITNVEIQLKEDKKPIPLENKGAGYRRLFMVGRLRYLAEKKQSQNVIYLVEEPETFLHPSAQEEMLRSLLMLSESNQIFVTTHSPIFAGATKQNSLTLCRKVDSGIQYEQRSDSDFLIDIALQLGVKPTHNILDKFKVIVFVEGSNDRKFLKIASRKLKRGLHLYEESGQVAILDGGGQSLNNFIDQKYFLRQDKRMFLIIDSDVFDESQITDPNVRKSYELKQKKNQELKTKFESNDKCTGFILRKKNIDTYYHPLAINRLMKTDIVKLKLFSDNFCTATYLTELKGLDPSLNMPKKNWIEVFDEMTEEEWVEVSQNELESIIDTIVAEVEN